MSNSILLSKEHGLNPSILKCYVCGGDIGIALLGKLPNDKEAPKECINGELCNNCIKKLETEILVLEYKDDCDKRTGRYIFVPKDVFKEVFEHSIVAMREFDFNLTFNRNGKTK